jgi:hypothetical protein
MRSLATLALVLCAACALTACGGGATSLDPVASAASKTAKISSEKMSATIEMQLPQLGGKALKMTMEGATDNVAKRGAATIDMSQFAQSLPQSAPASFRDPGLWKGEEVFDNSSLSIYM